MPRKPYAGFVSLERGLRSDLRRLAGCAENARRVPNGACGVPLASHDDIAEGIVLGFIGHGKARMEAVEQGNYRPSRRDETSEGRG